MRSRGTTRKSWLKDLDQLTNEEHERLLLFNWRYWAREKQLPPQGDWGTWLIRGGRGSGKTRCGGGWIHERAMQHAGRWIAIVGRTPADIRDYCIEGPGGILRNTHQTECPLYEVSKRRLTWPNGSWATIYSDEEPDQLRGFSGDTAWLDEFAKFRNARTTWDNLEFGMREPSGDRPRRVITTTPRPLQIMQEIEKMSDTVTVTMSSYDNRFNLDKSFFETTIARYEGTRLGRQEIYAEYLTDVPNALWTQAILDQHRVTNDKLPDMQRIVVGVDPSGTKGKVDEHTRAGDEIGIIVAGYGVDGYGYVLNDYTCNLGPVGWGRRVCQAYHTPLLDREWQADRVVAETNYGGAMVESTIKSIDAGIPFKGITASRGKVVRAEPIASLYEQGRIRHLNTLPHLEDQLLRMTTKGYEGDRSPDRLDAMVWALTELFLEEHVKFAFA